MDLIPLDKLQYADFTPYLNQPFRLVGAGTLPDGDASGPIELELVHVVRQEEEGWPGARRPFSLLFRGPLSDYYLLQRIYRLEHDRLGAMEIFLVPLGPERGRMRYEAVFG